MTKEELYAIADSPFEFKMGKYMSEGFDIFKKNAGGFIGLLFLSIPIAIGLQLIPFIGGLVLFFVKMLIHGGVIAVNRKVKHNEPVQFNDFFAYFKNPGSVIGYAAIIMLFMVLASTPLFLVMYFKVFNGGDLKNVNPEVLLSMLWIFPLLFIPMLVVLIAYIFSFNILLFINDNYWVAFEGSRRVAFKKFFPILGMLIVMYFISIFAILFTLGLGILVIIPWFHATITMAFEDIYKPSVNTFDSKVDSFGSFEKDMNTEAEEKYL